MAGKRLHEDFCIAVAPLLGSSDACAMLLERLDATAESATLASVHCLRGWGMRDPTVGRALRRVANAPAADLQHSVKHLPSILLDPRVCRSRLLEVCALPDVDDLGELISAFGAPWDRFRLTPKWSAAIWPHLITRPNSWAAECLITHLHGEARVREFALTQIDQMSGPIATIADGLMHVTRHCALRCSSAPFRYRITSFGPWWKARPREPTQS